MKNPLYFLLIPVIFSFSVVYGQKSPSADNILKEAFSKASAEKKNVFIIFQASWCGWCHKMQASINDNEVKNYFDNNYIIRYLTVNESHGNEYLENQGAADLLKKYNGNNQGIPYWLVFDKDGNLLADSKIRKDDQRLESGENSGCPAGEEEVSNFVRILKQTSSLSDLELAVIEKRFRQNEIARQ